MKESTAVYLAEVLLGVLIGIATIGLWYAFVDRGAR